MEIVDWQPGNGTRYLLAYGEVNGQWFVSWLKHSDVAGPSFKWQGSGVDLDYMADKMNINIADAQGIATFLYTKGIVGRLHWQDWYTFQRAEELGFDNLLQAS
jgi:hypothetical protein